MISFHFPPDDVVTLFPNETAESGLAGPQSPGAQIKAGRFEGSSRRLALASDHGKNVDLSNQFVVFQFSTQPDGPALLESSAVEPSIDGSRDEPDILVAMEMLSFHLGAGEAIDRETRATMRINFGKDESSTDKRFETVFWSIAAGMNLYNEARGQRTDAKEFKTDFHKAFGNRPIEIPGGLGRLSFEVIKHREPKWWERIFTFLQSDTTKSLISVLGFPAITSQAIAAIDELLNRISDTQPEPLFKSIPMRFALSNFARDEFTGGNPRIKTGSLRQGFCLLARGRDFPTLNGANVVYYPAYDRLAPGEVSEADLVSGNYPDPLSDVTYAVFRVGMKRTRLDPTFNYNA
jgi:hypothetical protein